jgi:hypothetical protein
LTGFRTHGKQDTSGMPCRASSEWEVADQVSELFRTTARGKEFQVLHALADARGLLVNVDDAYERLATLLPDRRLSQQILILSKQNPAQFGRAIQQVRIIASLHAILLCRENVYPSPA